ncbi:MAG: hypothetical protein AABY22_17415, partial [Nanoarchaeota archaeon]
NLLQRAGSFAEQNINQPFEQNIVAPATGFIQGIENIPSNIANLGITGINKLLGSNITKFPTLDVAPHTPQAETGNIASFLYGPGAINAIGKIPELSSGVSKIINSIPALSHAFKGVSNILKSNPIATNIAGNAILGGSYSPDHPLLGMALGGASPIIGKGINYLSDINPLKTIFSKINPKQTMEQVQASHDTLENEAANGFKTVSNEVKKRGIENVDIDKNLINKIKDSKYLPETRATDKLLKEAETGNYDSLRDLQSELFHRGTSRMSSDLPSEQNIGEEILDLRDLLNEGISNHLKKNGQDDLDQILNNSMAKYKRLKDIYYNKNIDRAIPKLVHKDIREK